MKKVAILVAMLAITALSAVPAFAQSNEFFCAIPEGCDCNGDGTADVPAGSPPAACDQYVQNAEPPNNQPTAPTTQPDMSYAPVVSDPSTSPSGTSGDAPSSGDAAAPATGGSQGQASGGDFDPGVSSGSAAPGSTGTASATYGALPDTGGASPIALGAGALLLAGAMAARRMIR